MSWVGRLVPKFSLNRRLSRAARRSSLSVVDRRHVRVDQDQAAGHRAKISAHAGNYESPKAERPQAQEQLPSLGPITDTPGGGAAVHGNKPQPPTNVPSVRTSGNCENLGPRLGRAPER
jgi:hypothetical protein